jgi:hypothetical protein
MAAIGGRIWPVSPDNVENEGLLLCNHLSIMAVYNVKMTFNSSKYHTVKHTGNCVRKFVYDYHEIRVGHLNTYVSVIV